MIVAWWIGYLMCVEPTCPDMGCETVFCWEEWQAVWIVAYKFLPDKPHTLNEVIRVIASFGGFMRRKRDGESGSKILWIGRQRVMDLAT